MVQLQEWFGDSRHQRWPWVGSIHGLGWVGLGWVGLGRIFYILMGWIGLGQKVANKFFFSKFNFFYCTVHTILGTTALHYLCFLIDFEFIFGYTTIQI